MNSMSPVGRTSMMTCAEPLEGATAKRPSAPSLAMWKLVAVSPAPKFNEDVNGRATSEGQIVR